MSHFGRSWTVLDTPDTLVSILNLTTLYCHVQYCNVVQESLKSTSPSPSPSPSQCGRRQVLQNPLTRSKLLGNEPRNPRDQV